ncbi:MAG: prepilin-type N-terminal cleavage/methylation domain-containing protein, partial [Pseudoalteromonas sp.]|nr:prepilin-type N-terminal cleavage/methylation domain-containing protein [Pseudoalteromonas sp.]
MTLSKKANTANIVNKTKGFTLLELIIVIIILGVMSVGIAGFITLSTQTYLNVSERDELLANARFVTERLNREIRNAVPNSIRINSNSTTECLEFIPIKASTTYMDIPVIPELASKNISIIPFQDSEGNAYQCS